MARSGQITVTTAGTAVQGPNQAGQYFSLAAHPDNTDTVWVGTDNAAAPDVSASTGYPLKAGASPVVVEAANLNEFWFDADVNGEKVCWLRLS